MENYFPSDKLVRQCVQEFESAPPLYRLEEAESDYYSIYSAADAAVDTLTANGITFKQQPHFMLHVKVLANVAALEIPNYKDRMKMRNTLQGILNERVSIKLVDQQG